MAATLKDVAEHAGVSIATVSRVLNEPEKVAEQSRIKVLNAIDELGYSSNLLAKSLRKDGLNAVFVLLPSLSDPFFAQINQGISDVLASYGYLMLTVATEGMHNLEEEYLLKAKSMGLAGVLIYTAHRRMPSSWEAFCANFPILFLSNTDPLGVPNAEQLPIPWGELGSQIASYLLKQGRRRFLYLANDISGFSPDFLAGLQSTVQQAGGLCGHCRADASLDDAARELNRYCRQSGETPDAVITQNCFQGAGVLLSLAGQKLHVPQDVAVLCLENSRLAQLPTPQLSVWGPSGYQVGVVGSRRLLDLIRAGTGEALPPLGDEIGLTLIARGSTDAAE